VAEPEDVARAVRYLAVDASANVTGHILRVDGGWTAW
jgi:NAD(P)-dependent dehydrogenase (short-subunit alcohol dehydrogenase family)